MVLNDLFVNRGDASPGPPMQQVSVMLNFRAVFKLSTVEWSGRRKRGSTRGTLGAEGKFDDGGR